MNFNKPNGSYCIFNFQINSEIYEKMGTEVFDFSHSCDIEWR